MAVPVPQYTKSRVNWAGQIISSDKPNGKDLYLAREILDNWRACHNYPINTFNATLRERLQRIGVRGIVAQRLKRSRAIIEKLQRFAGMRLSRMQDIAGLRAIVETTSEVRKLVNLYKNPKLLKHELIRYDDYISTPKTDGYRSAHLVYKYKSKTKPDYNGLLVELQVRTRLQHAWATAVETMGTVLGQNIKAQRGDKEWAEFFSVTASAFAHMEKTQLVPGYETMSREDTFKAVRKASAELRALEKMKSYSKAVQWIGQQKESWSYHLIILNSTAKTIEIKSYARNDFERATNDLTLAEFKQGLGKPIEPVLVSVGPIKTLQKAYPNFFLDINDFMRIIENITSLPSGR